MVRKRQVRCRTSRCEEPAGVFGRCAEHQAEFDEQERLYDRARAAIVNLTVDGAGFTSPELKDEMRELNRLWMRATSAMQRGEDAPEFGDETRYVTSYAVQVALVIVEQEMLFRMAKPRDATLDALKAIHWDRFVHLKAGRASNGTPRA